MSRIEPARPAFATDGTPMSPRYGDVYHSADSGPGQARHVFLGGNGLPGRWAGRDAFTILETGFGLGVNFLATWDAWRRDAARPARLHYVAIEKHPFERGDLASLLRAYPELGELAPALVDRWPPPLPGTHRRAFDGGGVTLTIVFDDVASAPARLDARADAIFLDGFAPSHNPEMWTAELLRRVAGHASAGATCATWSTARAVRDALAAAGFATETRPGFGRKREMLAGRYEPRGGSRRGADPGSAHGGCHALVVGAGLAGTAAACSLASRGWRISLVDAGPRAASGASSLHAGCFHPLVARDDSLLARLSRAAFLHALDAWRELERRGHRIAWEPCGLLQLVRQAEDEASLRAAIEGLGFPSTFVEAVDASEGALRTGWPVDRGGAWYPEGGWARAPSIVRAQLDAAMSLAGSTFVAGRRVHALARTGDGWRAVAGDGATLAEAPVVVLASAADLARLAPIGTPIRSVRGQATYVPATRLAAPKAVVIGNGYVLPDVDGTVVIGSSYDIESTEPEPTLEAHRGNLARLAALAGEAAVAGLESAGLGAGVGFRAVVADRMPVVGPLPDPAAPAQDPDDVAVAGGLYAIGAFASRGLIWSALAGEILASAIVGEPLPVETDLARAVDPGRFLRRAARRGVRRARPPDPRG